MLPKSPVVIETIVGRSPENRDRGSMHIATSDSLHVDIHDAYVHVHVCVSASGQCMQCWFDQVSGYEDDSCTCTCTCISKTID